MSLHCCLAPSAWGRVVAVPLQTQPCDSLCTQLFAQYLHHSVIATCAEHGMGCVLLLPAVQILKPAEKKQKAIYGGGY
jgi:hypothetical protein